MTRISLFTCSLLTCSLGDGTDATSAAGVEQARGERRDEQLYDDAGVRMVFSFWGCVLEAVRGQAGGARANWDYGGLAASADQGVLAGG